MATLNDDNSQQHHTRSDIYTTARQSGSSILFSHRCTHGYVNITCHTQGNFFKNRLQKHQYNDWWHL